MRRRQREWLDVVPAKHAYRYMRDVHIPDQGCSDAGTIVDQDYDANFRQIGVSSTKRDSHCRIKKVSACFRCASSIEPASIKRLLLQKALGPCL